MSGSVSNNHLLSLQLLRAVAAWLVVFHHYMQIVHGFESDSVLGEFFATRGDFGVDLFFVLSGVVMVLTLDKRATTSLQFLKKRCVRIIPAYWTATLVLCLMLPSLQDRLPSITFSLGKLITSLFFVPSPNLFSSSLYPILTVGWTLDFEMAFYVVISLRACY